MQSIANDDRVVAPYVVVLSCAKMAERIDVFFGVEFPRSAVLDGGPHPMR